MVKRYIYYVILIVIPLKLSSLGNLLSKHNTESMKQFIFLILIGFVLVGGGCDLNFASKDDFTNLETKVAFLQNEIDEKPTMTDNEIFNHRVTCQEMVDRFKKRYNNTTGGYYETDLNTCMIKYSVDGKEEVTSMELLSDK